MSKQNIAQRITTLMANNGISEAELARQTGIPQTTLHKILSGKTQDPRTSTLLTLANYFEVLTDTLLCESHYCYTGVKDVESAYFVASDRCQLAYRVPLIPWELALKGVDFVDSLSAETWQEWVLIEDNPAGLFALISKAAMAPRFSKGSILIVDSRAKPCHGDVVVAYYPDTNEPTLRDYRCDGPQYHLQSLDNTSCDILSTEVQLFGCIIQVNYRFPRP